MVIKRNSYYNTGRFHRRKNTRKQLGLEIHMDWSLSTLFETGLNILSWLAWNSQVHFSQIFTLGPFCLWLLYFQEGWIFWDKSEFTLLHEQ